MARKNKQDTQPSASIRIIGGRWRGRKLPVLGAPGLRPTPDRVRETLFNWLMHDIQDAVCLDVCAGSGALGFEALSRGAAYVDCIEQDAKVITQLKQNQQALNLDEQQITIHHDSAEVWLGRASEKKYDVVFVDPPYQANLLVKLLTLLIEQAWLNEGAKVYFESGTPLETEALPKNYQIIKEKKAGQVHYYLAVLGV